MFLWVPVEKFKFICGLSLYSFNEYGVKDIRTKDAGITDDMLTAFPVLALNFPDEVSTFESTRFSKLPVGTISIDLTFRFTEFHKYYLV